MPWFRKCSSEELKVGFGDLLVENQGLICNESRVILKAFARSFCDAVRSRGGARSFRPTGTFLCSCLLFPFEYWREEEIFIPFPCRYTSPNTTSTSAYNESWDNPHSDTSYDSDHPYICLASTLGEFCPCPLSADAFRG